MKANSDRYSIMPLYLRYIPRVFLAWLFVFQLISVAKILAQDSILFPQAKDEIWLVEHTEIESFRWGLRYAGNDTVNNYLAEGYFLAQIDDAKQNLLLECFMAVYPAFSIPDLSEKPVIYFYIYEVQPLEDGGGPKSDPNSQLELAYIPQENKLLLIFPDGPMEYPEPVEADFLLYKVLYAYHSLLEHTGKIPKTD
jgi:hypothetical protein